MISWLSEILPVNQGWFIDEFATYAVSIDECRYFVSTLQISWLHVENKFLCWMFHVVDSAVKLANQFVTNRR
jgi:hypothetical protein